MTDTISPNKSELAQRFFAWQCRLRQIAMREDEGRPSQGMGAKVVDNSGNVLSERMVTLITRNSPQESTEFFKFQVQKHHDPQDVYKKGLTYLQATHYHRANEFCDELTALFAPSSNVAKTILISGICSLIFEQFSQKFTITCQVRRLENDLHIFQATLWHNRLFNRNLSDDVIVLGFKPCWQNAEEG